MTLILSNEEIEQILSMKDLVPAIEEAYVELIEGRGANRLRSDIVTPTTQCKDGLYALKSMDGVIPKFGVGAIRINSDILTFPETGGLMRRVKVPAAPGNRYVGLVLLFSTHDGAPLLICPDGVMQHMRVGATSAVAAKYMAKKGSRIATIIGSGWQARTQLRGLDAVFDLKEIRVFSPNKQNRDNFVQQMGEMLGKEIRSVFIGRGGLQGFRHRGLRDQCGSAGVLQGMARAGHASRRHQAGRHRNRAARVGQDRSVRRARSRGFADHDLQPRCARRRGHRRPGHGHGAR